MTDCVAIDATGAVLMIERGRPPYEGMLALPGGFVDIGETVEDACRRELAEETGVKAGRLRLIGVYSAPDRDPRGHTVSVAFLARVRAPIASAGDDAAGVRWVKRSHLKGLSLAFDHERIVRDAIRLLARS